MPSFQRVLSSFCKKIHFCGVSKGAIVQTSLAAIILSRWEERESWDLMGSGTAFNRPLKFFPCCRVEKEK